jgi:RNA exonuclease 4
MKISLDCPDHLTRKSDNHEQRRKSMGSSLWARCQTQLTSYHQKISSLFPYGILNQRKMAVYPKQDSLSSMDKSSINSNPRSNHVNISRENSESSLSSSSHSSSSDHSSRSGKYLHNYKKPAMPAHSQYVAMDCEMVATVTNLSACARVVLVDWKGRTILDVYVKQTETVTDYRTYISGITANDLERGEPIESVQEQVQELLEGKILIGHGLENDMDCLGISHPWYMIRDTASYEPFMKTHFGVLAPRKLRDLAKEKLQKNMQMPGEAHDPREDATTALDLYKCHRPRWEACMHSKIKESQRLVREQVRQQQIQHQLLLVQQQQQRYYFQHGMPTYSLYH